MLLSNPEADKVKNAVAKDLRDMSPVNMRFTEAREEGNPPTIIVKGTAACLHGAVYFTYVTSPDRIRSFYGEPHQREYAHMPTHEDLTLILKDRGLASRLDRFLFGDSFVPVMAILALTGVAILSYITFFS